MMIWDLDAGAVLYINEVILILMLRRAVHAVQMKILPLKNALFNRK